MNDQLSIPRLEDTEGSSINMNLACHARAHTKSVPEIIVENIVGGKIPISFGELLYLREAG